MKTYDELIADMNTHTTNNMAIIECVKDCGYAFFIQVYLRSNVADLHNMVCDCIGAERGTVSLQLRGWNIADVELAPNSQMTIRQLRIHFAEYVKPVYPLPARLVYRIHINDTA